MNITENLNRIQQAKSDIRDAIIQKGGTVSEDAKIDEYADAVENIPAGGDDSLDKLFDKTIEEIHSTTPVKYGQYLFYGQGRLRVADIVIDSNAFAAGYANMFYSCNKLTVAPKLTATTLASSCYSQMFRGCTALATAPELPATTLAASCYSQMFYGCTSLTKTPDLPATTLVGYCYQNMFYGCSSLQKTGKIYATGNISSATSSMFNGCTSLREMTWMATTPPTINANIWTNCPSDMVIYVPDEAVDAYKAANVWETRADYIKPMSEKPTEE